MARYSGLLGRRVVVQYRAGDILLPATGTLAADSGRSVFLEEHFSQHGKVKTFRWEIPYPCILSLAESGPAPLTLDSGSPSTTDQAAEQAGISPFKHRPKTV